VRADWEEVKEIVAAANVHTSRNMALTAFSVSRDSGDVADFLRFRRTLPVADRGACGSFTTGIATCRPRPPDLGEQTDVPESADWYNSTYIIVCGSSLPTTRTRMPTSFPRCVTRRQGHLDGTDYASIARHPTCGCRSIRYRYAAFLAMGHVALKEFYIDKQDPISRICPQVHRPANSVMLRKHGEAMCLTAACALRPGRRPGRNQQSRLEDHRLRREKQILCRAERLDRLPLGEEGKWNLLPRTPPASRNPGRTVVHRQQG